MEYLAKYPLLLLFALAVSVQAAEPVTPKIRLSEKAYDFGTVNPLEVLKHTFEICNDGSAPLVIREIQVPSTCVTYLAQTEIVPKGKAKLEVVAIASGKESPIRYEIIISSNDPNVPRENIIVKGRLPNHQEMPNLQFSERTYSFGNIRQGDRVEHVFVFKNIGEGDLIVKKINSYCGCTASLLQDDTIPSKGEGRLKVTFRSEGSIGKQNKCIFMHSNDPHQPVVKLTLAGIVTPVRGADSEERGEIEGVKAKSEALMIDSAYLRQAPDYDNGTIHVFVKNASAQALEIVQLYLNDRPLDRSPNDGSIWHDIRPNPVPPRSVSDVMINLAFKSEACLRVGIEASSGQILEIELDPVPNMLKFSHIGFDRDLKTIYAYIKNESRDIFRPEKVYLGSTDVSEMTKFLHDQIGHGKRGCLKIVTDRPLERGSYLGLKVVGRSGSIIQNVVRVFSRFPISSYRRIDKRTRLFFDTVSFHVGDYGRFPSLAVLDDSAIGAHAPNLRAAENQNDKVYNLWGSQCFLDHTAEKEWINETFQPNRAGRGCQWLLEEAARLLDINRNFPTFNKFCGSPGEHPRSDYYIYGELTDIFGFSSHQFSQKKQPKEEVDDMVIGKDACEPRPLIFVPTAFGVDSQRVRLPVREEERLLVYYAVARGAKGILYRTGSKDYTSSSDLEQEIGRINAELQVLKRYLAIGEPYPGIASCDVEDVESTAILAGDRGIVILLINEDHRSIFHWWSEKYPFQYRPKRNLKVKVTVPKWMKIAEIYEVGGGWAKLRYKKRKDNVFIIPIEELAVTKQIVMSVFKNDFAHDQDRDGVSDIQEVSVFGTHPDLAPQQFGDGIGIE